MPLIGLTLLAGCGGAVSSQRADIFVANNIGMGTASGASPASGLGFAKSGEDVRDLETIPVTVRMGRMQRDGDAVRFFFSDEVVTLSDGFYEGFYRPSTFTLDGVEYVLTSGGIIVDGTNYRQTDREYDNNFLSGARHEIAFVTNGYPDVFHEYAVFIMGFETDPAALPGGVTRYEGQFNIDTWPSENGGIPSNNYRPFNGTLGLNVDFDNLNISGDFSGTAQIGANTQIFDENVFGVIPEVTLTGNGFEGQMVFTDCLGVTSCGGEMTIGGAVYGPNGERIAGLIISDATFVRDSDGVSLRLLGPGVFYADKE